MSVLAIAIAAAFILSGLFSVLGSMAESSVQPADADVMSQLLANNLVMEDSEKRFTGRSIFYIPREPRRPAPPPPPPREPVEETAPPPPPPPTIPAKYAGPAPKSILGNDVFFEGSLRIPQGETASGVKVVLVRGPFDIRLGWKGGEYEINLFEEEIPDFFSTLPFANGQSSNLLQIETIAAPNRSTESASSRGSAFERMRADPEGAMAARGKTEENVTSSRSSEIPEPLSEEQIKNMSRLDAARAMNMVSQALRNDIDVETRERLEKENTLLRAQIRSPRLDPPESTK